MELIAATSGLGYVIMQAGDYLNTGLVFSGIFLIAVLGLVLDACPRAAAPRRPQQARLTYRCRAAVRACRALTRASISACVLYIARAARTVAASPKRRRMGWAQ